MSWGRLLNGGYSGASNHSRMYSPASIALDGREPEAREFAFLVPVGGQHPRADPQGFSRGGAVRLAARRRGRGGTSGFRRARTRRASVRVLF